ncbi:MAG: ATP-binding cassette domain-containing protein [Candidatus Omnitrophota bacterium]
MALISLQEITLAFGGPLIFDKLNLQLETKERVALLGRNGAGKTTLMKVLCGEMEVGTGDVIYQKGVKIAYLPQEVPLGIKGSVFEVVLSGLDASVKLLAEYHHLTNRLQTENSPELMRRLGVLQSQIDHIGGWDLNSEAEIVIGHMKLDPESDFEKLSGGQKRRALLARALVSKPDVLLLDEPTNHLDIDSIDWLEGFLKEYSGTILFITHDRTFMTHLATRIIELDRGKLLSWDCDYRTFLERKNAALENEAVQWAQFDKKLAQEEIWIRKGVKARRCREEGRVNALKRLREEKRNQRKVLGLVRMNAQEAVLSGHQVVKAAHVGFSYGDNCIIRDLTTRIMRGDKIGLIGPNGSGKTTLLKVLLGKLAPDKGKIRLGTNIEVAYYDQLREELDEEKTVQENVCPGGDVVTVNGKPRHIIGYLQDFLFTPDRARTPIKVLSGGERNRLFLAKLFTKPSNLLVMDEPTNDLDIETLELLEELLLEYSGTLILVSHDRAFLNNVVTSTIVLEGSGEVNEYPGGYDDWLDQRAMKAPEAVSKAWLKKEGLKPKEENVPRKLTFKERKEFEGLMPKIEKLEEEQKQIFSLFADSDFYKRPPNEIADAKARSEAIKGELMKAYDRWEYLEALRKMGPDAIY